MRMNYFLRGVIGVATGIAGGEVIKKLTNGNSVAGAIGAGGTTLLTGLVIDQLCKENEGSEENVIFDDVEIEA